VWCVCVCDVCDAGVNVRCFCAYLLLSGVLQLVSLLLRLFGNQFCLLTCRTLSNSKNTLFVFVEWAFVRDGEGESVMDLLPCAMGRVQNVLVLSRQREKGKEDIVFGIAKRGAGYCVCRFRTEMRYLGIWDFRKEIVEGEPKVYRNGRTSHTFFADCSGFEL
jgi:hypothetical protein